MNEAQEEVVATIEAFASSLQGNADAFAAILVALAEATGRVPGEVRDYSELTEEGRRVYESSDIAWDWFKCELEALAHKLKHTAEFYI